MNVVSMLIVVGLLIFGGAIIAWAVNADDGDSQPDSGKPSRESQGVNVERAEATGAGGATAEELDVDDPASGRKEDEAVEGVQSGVTDTAPPPEDEESDGSLDLYGAPDELDEPSKEASGDEGGTTFDQVDLEEKPEETETSNETQEPEEEPEQSSDESGVEEDARQDHADDEPEAVSEGDDGDLADGEGAPEEESTDIEQEDDEHPESDEELWDVPDSVLSETEDASVSDDAQTGGERRAEADATADKDPNDGAAVSDEAGSELERSAGDEPSGTDPDASVDSSSEEHSDASDDERMEPSRPIPDGEAEERADEDEEMDDGADPDGKDEKGFGVVNPPDEEDVDDESSDDDPAPLGFDGPRDGSVDSSTD